MLYVHYTLSRSFFASIFYCLVESTEYVATYVFWCNIEHQYNKIARILRYVELGS